MVVGGVIGSEYIVYKQDEISVYRVGSDIQKHHTYMWTPELVLNYNLDYH